MSKYIDEIRACKGDDKKIESLLEKSFMKLLLDIVLLLIIVLFYKFFLNSLSLMISKGAAISTYILVGLNAITYGGFAAALYLLIKHCIPFFMFGIQKGVILLLNTIVRSIKKHFPKKIDNEMQIVSVESVSADEANKEVPESPAESDSAKEVNNEMQGNSVETDHANEANNRVLESEQKIVNYIKSYRKKYIIGYAFKWLSENGNLGGMSQEKFRMYIQDNYCVTTSAGNISKYANEASDLLNDPRKNPDKHKEYQNMAEQFNSYVEKNQLLFTKSEEK